MRYVSLFSGIGGFELGLQYAHERLRDGRNKLQQKASKGKLSPKRARAQGEGVASDKHIGEPAPLVCVGFSEVDRYATTVYQRHFPLHPALGDITAINPDGLPDFELLCGGFPCQSFSIAGKRGGFEDTRGTLFFHIARIAAHKRPRVLFLENVKGLLSHDDGRTFNTIISALDELGYDLQWQVLNSKHFGVPQNRERVFIVGHLRGTPRPQVFPLQENREPDIVLPTLTARYYGAQANGGYVRDVATKVGTLRTHKDGRGFREKRDGLVPTIPARAREDGSGQPIIFDPYNNAQPKDQEAVTTLRTNHTNGNPQIIQTPRGQNKGGAKKISPTLSSHSFQNNNHVAYTLKARADSGIDEKHPQSLVKEDSQIRRLTPIECERLQGFPDGWTEGVSDSQRYKTLGNAVTVNVIEAIALRLL